MKFFMLGIGGVSMSALAVMLKELGHEVVGSDERFGKGVEILQEEGIEVFVTGQDFSGWQNYGGGEKREGERPCKEVFFQIKKSIADCDIVVRSAAIKEDDAQIVLAKKLGKKIRQRGWLLGQISENYEKVIAVAGSHGKTTTTAMIYEILKMAGKNPTLHLGGYRADDGKNFEIGGTEFFVTEACEYHNNFLYLKPYIAVVTNVEKEHMDFFRTFENEKRSFEKFKQGSRFVFDNFGGIKAKNIRHDSQGRLKFTLTCGDKILMHLHMRICEEVNTQNCIYAYLVAKKLGIADCIIKQGLQNFAGVGTRFEKMKCAHFEHVVCDYAHHPTEISKAIASAQKIFKGKTLVTIFQPHTFSRTQSLLPQFLEVFEKVEHPLLFKTYSAREKESEGLSATQLAEILQKRNKNAKYFENFASLKGFLENFSSSNTILLFLGAGDLPQILKAEGFVE